MPEGLAFASGLIATGASGYGKVAAQLLFERHPEIEQRFGQGAFRSWSLHLTQRSRELAAALLVEEPDLFVAEVSWSEISFSSRQVPTEDLRASLQCLAEALQAELPDHLRGLPTPYIERALVRMSEPAAAKEPALGSDSPENKLALRYLEAALAGKRRAAIDLVLSAVEDGLDVRAAYSGVLQAALTHVGELWHAGAVSIAQEHFVTATSETVMTLLAHRSSPETDDGRTVVVAPVPGNIHRLGARALAHHFELAGWNTIHLGADVPAGELAQALELFDAHLLALSVALSTQLRGAIETLRAAREIRPDVKILVGGRVFAAAPELWRKIGADASAADLGGALEAADQLVQL